MAGEEARQLVDKLIEAHARRDSSAFEELVADDVRDRSPLPGHGRGGKQALRENGREILEAFPDLDAEVHDVVADGDKVVVHVTVRGTNKGSFRGKRATNKEVKAKGTAILRVQNGKIVEHSGVLDRGPLRRLGLFEEEDEE